MGPIVVFLAIIGFLILCVYLKFPPPYAKKRLVGVFNMMVLAVCALLCLVVALNIDSQYANTDEENWGLPLAIAGALGVEIVFLALCFVMRNFWIFRPPRPPGKGGFFGF